MAKFLIHYLCQYQAFYLKYALLSAHSLIRNGGVKAEQILFTIDPDTAAGVWNAGIDQLGCHRRILPDHGPHKLVCVEWAFEKFPEVETIIQLDSDTYLAETFSIADWVDHNPVKSLGCYDMKNALSRNIFIDRSLKLNYSAFRYKMGKYSSERFHRCLKLLCHVDHREFYKWISAQVWPWGTLILFRRNLLGTPFWETAINHDLISACDESALMLGVFRDREVALEFFGEELPRQVLVSGKLKEAIAAGQGLLHYAGDHGKEGCREEVNRMMAEIFPGLSEEPAA